MSIEEFLRQLELGEAAELVDDHRLLKFQGAVGINEVEVAATSSGLSSVALPSHPVRARLVNS